MKKKLKDFNIKNYYSNIIKYIKTNRLFLTYIILSLICTILLRGLTLNRWFYIKPLLFDLSVIILIGSFSYLFKPKNRFKYLFTCFTVIMLICLINGIYFTFYSSFASFSLLSALGQVSDVSDAVFDNLKITHFIYIIPFLIFLFINKYLKNKDYFGYINKINKGKSMFVSTFIVSIILVIFNCLLLESVALSRLNKQWDREYIVNSFGIIIYQGNDLIHTLQSKINTMFGYDEAREKFDEYFKNKEDTEKDNKYTDIYKGKNLVFVHMESMMSFLVNLKINGVEITPNLNKLTKEGMYFSNFYPEISVGTSSDTEFTLNTSLLPVTSGTVFVSYYDRYYESIERLLKEQGYYTFSMHANKASMWNRNKMHPNLGYTDMYFQDKYNIDEVVGLGLSDVSFFNQIVPILKNIEETKEPYMGTIITLSNHTPFNDVDKYFDLDLTYKKTSTNELGEEIEETYDYLENRKLGDYIKSANYADYALGKFIDSLYENDIMDNTVFVFYGDHAAQLSKNEFKYYYNYDFETGEMKDEDDPTYIDYDYYLNELNKKTPLIIWTKNKKIKKEVKYYMGMIDVMPTIGNMFGFVNNYALGHDIFDIKNNNIIPFPNGNFLTNKVYYNNSKEEYKVLSDDPIDETYIEDCKKYTEDVIEISNNIIIHNLIKDDKEGDNVK